jgi:hypothetical protein
MEFLELLKLGSGGPTIREAASQRYACIDD